MSTPPPRADAIDAADHRDNDVERVIAGEDVVVGAVVGAGDPADTTRPPAAIHRMAGWIRSRPAGSLLVVAMAAWLAVFSALIWHRHARFGTWDFDLGHHDQAIWLLSRGGGFVTVSGMPVLGHHFTVAYFAVAPLYWLGGGPQLINLLQTAALALSAVPIYLYARDRLANEWHALALGVAWLLNPSVQWLCWEAWHPETMAIPFLLTAYLLASRRRWRWYAVILVAALTWKEDVALAAIVLGIVFLLRRQRRIGLFTIAVGVAWFVLAYQIAMPHFNGGQNHAGIFYGELGDSPSEIARTAVTDPGAIWERLRGNDALGYARDLLVPFAAVPLLAPLVTVVAVPQFFANALTNAGFFYDIRFHYVAIIVAVLAIAGVDGAARFTTARLRSKVVGTIVAAALASSVAWGLSPLSTQYRSGYWVLDDNPRQAVLDAAVDAVPGGAATAASYYIVPHLSHREQIYTFPNPWIAANWGLAGEAPHDPDHDHVGAEVDWLVVDTTTHGADSREELLLDELLAAEFRVVSDDSGIVVARRVARPGGADVA